MATKSFLSPSAFEEAQSILQPPAKAPSGPESPTDFRDREFSRWLAHQLETGLVAQPAWKKAIPVAIGSWARGEICPKSDFDLIFCGDVKAVEDLVDYLHRAGLKIRYRMPLKADDWCAGVEAFDILALMQGRALTPDGELLLLRQKQSIWNKGPKFARTLMRAMVQERKARAARYDSIANFLEPNLKYGAGGLRDLEQALMITTLFPERFIKAAETLKILNHYKSFFLTIRQKLHLMNGTDILSATEQEEVGRWLHYPNKWEFMREVQKGLSRVSFCADWVIEQARASKAQLKKIERSEIKNLPQAIQALHKDSSILMQHRVRRSLSAIEGVKISSSMGRALEKIIRPAGPEVELMALFRSGVMELCFPEIRRLAGWVQHDQYHRFTADTHLMQAMREVQRVYRKPQLLGRLKKYANALSSSDWRILLWSALYHDIAKGKQGDHSKLGIAIAGRELKALGMPASLISEVQWLVENHLLLSEAAFRKNPRSVTTWRGLFEQQIHVGKRLSLLAIFTVIDIRATNPDAWNKWKEQLLNELIETLQSAETESYFHLLSEGQQRHVTLNQQFVQRLEAQLVKSVPARILLNDYKELEKAGSLEPLVWRKKPGTLWVRFHQRDDRAGLFVQFVSSLFNAGCGITYASVQTIPNIGAYDWFQIRTRRSPAQLKRLLQVIPANEVKPPRVRFDTIQIMSQDDQECIISFRGRDQSGALMAAATALYAAGLTIQWARVHTWGGQIDDIFSVQPTPKFAEAFAYLQADLGGKS